LVAGIDSDERLERGVEKTPMHGVRAGLQTMFCHVLNSSAAGLEHAGDPIEHRVKTDGRVVHGAPERQMSSPIDQRSLVGK